MPSPLNIQGPSFTLVVIILSENSQHPGANTNFIFPAQFSSLSTQVRPKFQLLRRWKHPGYHTNSYVDIINGSDTIPLLVSSFPSKLVLAVILLDSLLKVNMDTRSHYCRPKEDDSGGSPPMQCPTQCIDAVTASYECIYIWYVHWWSVVVFCFSVAIIQPRRWAMMR